MTSSLPPTTVAPADQAARLGRWAVVAAWASLVLTAGAALADALDGRSRPVQLVASAGLWLAWAAALGAALVPRTATLTAVRILVPAAVPVTAWALVAAPAPGVLGLIGLGTAVAATVVVLSAVVGDGFVNGSSYGDERRLPLRPPAALLLGPLELAWAVCVTGAVAGPLLLAAGAWAAGAVALVVGWPLAAGAARALHGLARRWLVFVPAGFVLHDPSALVDPVLLPRRLVARLGPAPADTHALDLTVGALGLALQVDLTEPTPVALAPRRARGRDAAAIEPAEARALLFSPSRPGAVLREAERRRLPVGSP